MPATVVLLHGFAGTGRAWDPVVARLDPERYTALAPDLRGHGAARDARPVAFAACVADVLAAAPDALRALRLLDGRAHRAARRARRARAHRAAACSSPTTAGHRGRRPSARRAAPPTSALAAFAETRGIEAFADRWARAAAVRRHAARRRARIWREDCCATTRAALAASLRGLGTGAMAPLWGRLGELDDARRAARRRRDAKFVALGGRLAAALPQAALSSSPGAGHGLPREAPRRSPPRSPPGWSAAERLKVQAMTSQGETRNPEEAGGLRRELRFWEAIALRLR